MSYLNDQEQRLVALIASRERALLADLRLHVELPTGGGGRNAAALADTRDRLTTRARALGAEVELIPGERRPTWLWPPEPPDSAPRPPLPTAVCRRPGRGTPILIAGHLDTVHDPAGPFRELTVDPVTRRAVGPGCVDMKGGLVITLAALEALEEVGERLAWTLLLNSDEETGSYESAKAIIAEAARIAAVRGIGICVEPATAEGGLVIERAGSGQFMIEAHGKSAHVGRDFASGISAVEALAEAIIKAQKMARLSLVVRLSEPGAALPPQSASPDSIINIGPLEGGAATNIVPDHARAWGNFRFNTTEAGETARLNLESLAGVTPTGACINIHTSTARPAKPATPEILRLAELVRTTADALGQPPPALVKTAGVCDGNLMQAVGLPTLDTLGVRGGGLHTTNEWIDLKSLVERCQLLALFMLRVQEHAPTEPLA